MIVISIIIINVIKIVFGFLIEVNYFNISDLFSSSPLFDFSISNDCQGKKEIIFHRWEGRKDTEWTLDNNFIPKKQTVIVDQTDIKKIYGNYFCYKEKLYVNLLDNGQIIKKGEECPSEYKKNCGRLDTLEQELCIKENEKCPLYDIGLGLPPDTNNYISVDSKIYYNKDNYNEPNKTIVGRLILNDGQLCYNSTEKLWRKFSSKEGFETNSQCHMNIFNKYSDDRYEKKGSISYVKLYEDNLNSECQNLILNDIIVTAEVSLYKREFFGIDKQCDEKYNLNNNTYTILHNSEESERLLLIIGGIMSAVMAPIGIVIEIITACFNENFSVMGYSILYAAYIVFLLPIFISEAVFYSRIASNDVTGYNCSDKITNEIIRIGTETSTTNFKYIKISFYLEAAVFGATCFAALIAIVSEAIVKKIKKIKEESKKAEEKKKENTDINEKSETKADEIPLITYSTPS